MMLMELDQISPDQPSLLLNSEFSIEVVHVIPFSDQLELVSFQDGLKIIISLSC